MLIRTAIIVLVLTVVSICLLGHVLHAQSKIFRESQASLLSLQWMQMICIAVWCETFLLLTFSLNDLPLMGLLVIAVAMYFVGYVTTWQMSDAITLLFGVALEKGRASR